MKLSFFISFISVLFLTSCMTVPSEDTAIRFFNDSAFRGSPGGYPLQGEILLETDYSEHRMYRWEDEIRIELSGAVTPEYRHQVESTINRMTEITGIPARLVSPGGEEANFSVEFVEKANFNIRKTEVVPCYAHNTGDGKITGVTIKISVEKPYFAKHCVVHELFHGFGFAHSDLVHSVISTRSFETKLTSWDEMVLKVLYDPRLKSGMTRLEAMPIARKILLEMHNKS